MCRLGIKKYMAIEIKSLKEANIKSLALNNKFGDLKFEDSYPKLEEIKSWILEFIELNYEQYLPVDKVNELENFVNKYIEKLNWLENFSITTSPQPKPEHDNFENEVNDVHKSFFENFVVKYWTYLNLRNFDKNSLKNEVDLEQIRNAGKVAESIIKNEERYRKASETAENWIQTEGRAISSAIKDKTKIFYDKATNEHTGHKVWWWLIASGGFLMGAIIVAFVLIQKLSGNGESISIGASLLRMSVIGMFIYAAFLAYQQFSIQRRLYESYKFKAIALSTMEDLVKTYTEPKDRQFIINKAIDIIFSEPSLKEDKIAHQRMIDELIDILKSKV